MAPTPSILLAPSPAQLPPRLDESHKRRLRSQLEDVRSKGRLRGSRVNWKACRSRVQFPLTQGEPHEQGAFYRDGHAREDDGCLYEDLGEVGEAARAVGVDQRGRSSKLETVHAEHLGFGLALGFRDRVNQTLSRMVAQGHHGNHSQVGGNPEDLLDMLLVERPDPADSQPVSIILDTFGAGHSGDSSSSVQFQNRQREGGKLMTHLSIANALPAGFDANALGLTPRIGRVALGDRGAVGQRPDINVV